MPEFSGSGRHPLVVRDQFAEVLTDSLSAATFGAAASWTSDGLVHRGRVHMCGVARRV